MVYNKYCNTFVQAIDSVYNPCPEAVGFFLRIPQEALLELLVFFIIGSEVMIFLAAETFYRGRL